MGTILGLDVAFRSLGWSQFTVDRSGETLIAVGVITTEPETQKQRILVSEDDMRRGRELASKLIALFRLVQPVGVIAEIASGSQNAKACHQLGIAKGVMSALSAIFPECLTEWVTPLNVKKAVTGRRTASKREVWGTVIDAYPYFANWPKNKGKLVEKEIEHIADSIGAVWAAKQTGNVFRLAGQLFYTEVEL